MPRLSEAEYNELLMRRKQASDRAQILKKNGLGKIPEQSVLSAVRLHARLNGWLVYHTHDSRHSEPGFPDIVATNGEQILFAELKSATGKLTKDQDTWLNLLTHTGIVDVHLWRPEDMPIIIPNYFKGTP